MDLTRSRSMVALSSNRNAAFEAFSGLLKFTTEMPSRSAGLFGPTTVLVNA